MPFSRSLAAGGDTPPAGARSLASSARSRSLRRGAERCKHKGSRDPSGTLVRRCPISSPPSTSASSSSTARSAPGSRARTSPPTTSAVPTLEGCNENLVAHPARPHRRDARRVLRGRRRRGRDRHLRRLPDRARRVRHRRARPSSSTRPAARIAKEVAAEFATPGPAPLRHRLDRARAPSSRRSATSTSPTLRDDYEAQVDGPPRRRRRRPPHRDGPGPAPGARRRSSPAAGRWPTPAASVPLMVQVTIETTGRMLVGSEIGAALTALEALRPDVIGLNCATGPARDDRAPALPRAARAHVPLVPAQRRAAVDRRRAHALRPHARRSSPTRTSASSPSSASTSSAAAAAPRPSTSARSSNASATRAPAPRTPEYEPGCSSIYSPVPFHQDLVVPRHRRAHERQRLEEVPRRDARRRLGHLRADGPRAGEGRRPRPRRLRRLRRPRRRRRHGRDRRPLRHPGAAAAGARLHRAAGARGRAPALGRQGDPQLGQPRGRRRRRASASTA